jgi:hypothetical protein
MLELDSQKWKDFGTYFGKPEDIPRMIKKWENVIGKDSEGELWREVYNCVWHQNTIESAAFAVVPHLVNKLAVVSADRKIEYVIDLGFIEVARREWNDNDIPQILLTDYDLAVKESRKYAVECLDLAPDKITFRYLLGAVSSLYDQTKLGDILFHLDCIADECPKCGEIVYPSEIQESDYI